MARPDAQRPGNPRDATPGRPKSDAFASPGTSRITALEFPTSFTDEQVSGPFKAFRHVHEFQSLATGSIMTDRVEFTAPFGFLGRLAENLFLRRYLMRLISNRGRFLAGTGSRTGAH